jgi:hypothetical protein
VPICGTVSQISPPIRIVLVAVVGLLAAWMLFLRPKPVVTPAPAPASATAPGVTGLSNAVDKAKAASATSDKANEKLQQATGEGAAATGAATKPGSTSAKGQAATGAGSAKGLPAPVQKALNQNKILVLGFFNPKGADDRATRRSLAGVDRWRGEVVVRTANVKTVSRYGTIARGADVEQSPTIIVVDRNAKAERLDGYQDPVSIDQAVVDAMRASGGIIDDRYLSAINSACATAGVQQVAVPRATKPSEIRGEVASQGKVWKRFMTRFAAIKAPAEWRGLKRAALKDGKAMSANYAAWLTALGSNPSAAESVGTLPRFNGRSHELTDSWNARMDKQNVLSCGSQT